MQPYFVTKWGSIILGIGAFFVGLGLIILANPSLLNYYCGVCTAPAILPKITSPTEFQAITFSLFFYGGLEMAIGSTVLLLQHFRRHKARDLVLLNNQLD